MPRHSETDAGLSLVDVFDELGLLNVTMRNRIQNFNVLVVGTNSRNKTLQMINLIPHMKSNFTKTCMTYLALWKLGLIQLKSRKN